MTPWWRFDHQTRQVPKAKTASLGDEIYSQDIQSMAVTLPTLKLAPFKSLLVFRSRKSKRYLFCVVLEICESQILPMPSPYSRIWVHLTILIISYCLCTVFFITITLIHFSLVHWNKHAWIGYSSTTLSTVLVSVVTSTVDSDRDRGRPRSRSRRLRSFRVSHVTGIAF
jgi:hypothetical protein